MDVDTIEEVDTDAARAAYLEYRAAARKTGAAEDLALMRGYRALSQGKRIIDVVQAVLGGGFDDGGLPRLAFMRADCRWCWYAPRGRYQARPGFVGFEFQRTDDGQTSTRLMLPEASVPMRPDSARPAKPRALVPTIPPRHRPKGQLRRYHLLWEAFVPAAAAAAERVDRFQAAVDALRARQVFRDEWGNIVCETKIEAQDESGSWLRTRGCLPHACCRSELEVALIAALVHFTSLSVTKELMEAARRETRTVRIETDPVTGATTFTFEG